MAAVTPQSFLCVQHTEFNQTEIQGEKSVPVALLNVIAERIPPIILGTLHDSRAQRIQIHIRKGSPRISTKYTRLNRRMISSILSFSTSRKGRPSNAVLDIIWYTVLSSGMIILWILDIGSPPIWLKVNELTASNLHIRLKIVLHEYLACHLISSPSHRPSIVDGSWLAYRKWKN